ncbi:hypothetical protein J2744_001255 [Halorubrum trapanicum]|uniref:Uncharacterized protein n=1 Tax=Halorubrum trapanicum TaxID=29284 RepID=A0A8J7ULY9_9EURY|nr:hypothetical protein [Halorubrum trapanicum]
MVQLPPPSTNTRSWSAAIASYSSRIRSRKASGSSVPRIAPSTNVGE